MIDDDSCTGNPLCIHKRISCVYTRDLLCMHNTLVHALGQGTQGPGTQKGSGPGPGTGPAAFLGPWSLGSLAQSMHKSVVHAQEISCIHRRFFCVYTRDPLCRHKRSLVQTQETLTICWRLFDGNLTFVLLPYFDPGSIQILLHTSQESPGPPWK